LKYSRFAETRAGDGARSALRGVERSPLTFSKETKPRPLKTPLAVVGRFDTIQTKTAIQAELRRIAITRDGGCVLRHSYDAPSCGGFTKDAG